MTIELDLVSPQHVGLGNSVDLWWSQVDGNWFTLVKPLAGITSQMLAELTDRFLRVYCHSQRSIRLVGTCQLLAKPIRITDYHCHLIET